MPLQDTTMGGHHAGFPQTRWTAIMNATEQDHDAFREHVDHLITLYWKPVYTYIRRAWNKSNEDTKDLTQAYFLSLMERDSFRHLSPDKGRFRSFIKASLKHFLLQVERDQSRIKRGGGQKILSIDWDSMPQDLQDQKSMRPEEILDNQWIETLVSHASEMLQRTLITEQNEKCYHIFQEWYFPEGKRLSYEGLAEKYDMTTFDVGNALKKARTLFKTTIKDLIKETVTDDVECEREFHELFGGTL